MKKHLGIKYNEGRYVMTVNEISKKYEQYVIDMRRHFHQNPEASFQEVETSKTIRRELDKLGVPYVICGKEIGVLATIQGAKPGKTMLLRADMDALSVMEETGCSYASVKEGVMHACGHDCHAAMLLTAAHILWEMRDELSGTVKLAFQPAEETAVGAKAMIEEGAMDGVDACFGIHIWADIPVGKVSLEPGPRMASADMFTIEIQGKGGHAAQPHQCVDAAVVTAAMVNNLQTIVSRELSPLEPVVLTCGRIEVGSRWNVVAEYGRIEGTTRCFSTEIWNQWEGMIERVANDTAHTFRAEAKVSYTKLVPPTINDPVISALAEGAAAKVMGPDAVGAFEKTTGGEDFSYFIQKAPGIIAFLGCKNEAIGACYPHHSGKFCVDESALIKGAALYAQVAIDFNENI